LRLESIFSDNNCKNKEINNNLFNKNNNIIQSGRNRLNNDSNKNTNSYKINNKNKKSSLKTLPNSYDNNFLNIGNLKNNLKFNIINHQNNFLLQKKHRMDLKLQKSFDTDILGEKNREINMQTSLNLLNNKIKIKIKKSYY